MPSAAKIVIGFLPSSFSGLFDFAKFPQGLLGMQKFEERFRIAEQIFILERNGDLAQQQMETCRFHSHMLDGPKSDFSRLLRVAAFCCFLGVGEIQ